MSYSKTIVCLANSRKPPQGRCVAGRECSVRESNFQFGGWIRPVSERATREIDEEERRYSSGGDPQVLDIVQLHLANAVPDGYQQENHVIADGPHWERKGNATWEDVQFAKETPGQLWTNGDSSNRGENDQVREEHWKQHSSSLCLIEPENLRLIVATEYRGRRRIRAGFHYCGANYKLSVTDPWIEQRCFSGPDREIDVGPALLTVSLSEPFKGFAYKLVAAVITPNREG